MRKISIFSVTLGLFISACANNSVGTQQFAFTGNTDAGVAVSTTCNGYNVRSYGATGDGTTNDSPAIQAAVNAAIANAGGVICFPPGEYYMAGQIVVVPPIAQAQPYLVFQGSTGGSRLFLGMGQYQYGFFIGNVESVEFRDLMIGGAGSGSTAQTYAAISAGYTLNLLLHNIAFYSLHSVIGAIDSYAITTVVENCQFHSGQVDNTSRGLVNFFSVTVHLRDNFFVDYGNYGYALSGNAVAPYTYILPVLNSWVYVGNIFGQGGLDATGQNTITIERCGFDEGAAKSIDINNYGDPAGVKRSRVLIQDVNHLVNETSLAMGISVNNVDHLELRRVGFHVRADRPVLQLRHVGRTTIQHSTYKDGSGSGHAYYDIDDTNTKVRIDDTDFNQTGSTLNATDCKVDGTSC